MHPDLELWFVFTYSDCADCFWGGGCVRLTTRLYLALALRLSGGDTVVCTGATLPLSLP